MIFESHAHYDDKAFDKDREELLKSFPKQGIGRVINISSSLESVVKTIELAERYPYIYGAAGVHPSDTAELTEESFAWLRKQCAHEKVVAVGEIGLDYYWQEPDHETQKRWFECQMEMAKETGLPMIIHSRDAAKDTLDMMKALHAGETKGVIHCFSYGREMAREFLNLNFSFGIGGVVTFKNARKLREAVEYIPMEKILLETDSPYLSPEPNRGKRNSSLNLPYVAEAIAEIKGTTAEEVIRITEKNAGELFGV